MQLPLDDESKQYAVINTVDGLYQCQFLPYGMTASSGVFQSFITKTLHNIPNLIIYQDDMLILTHDHNSHVKVLRQVLTTLKNAGIKLNIKKCKFFVDSVQYLGHIFDKSGVRPNPDKTRCILEAPAPQNVKQVQAFVCLCNYYSRFIPNFATVMKLLYSLLEKNCTFVWNKPQQDAFESVKNLFKSNSILQHYDPQAQLMLETDAYAYGIGAVLMQRHNAHSDWLPVQFASRTLNAAERNYSNNVNSDCLSRLPLSETVSESEPYEIISTLHALDTDYISCDDIKKHTDLDPDLIVLKCYIKNGFPDRIVLICVNLSLLLLA